MKSIIIGSLVNVMDFLFYIFTRIFYNPYSKCLEYFGISSLSKINILHPILMWEGWEICTKHPLKTMNIKSLIKEIYKATGEKPKEQYLYLLEDD